VYLRFAWLLYFLLFGFFFFFFSSRRRHTRYIGDWSSDVCSSDLVGDYSIDTYMVIDGHIETKKTTHLEVHKVGIEAQIYNFAHQHALIYGLLAIVIAVVSGWTANAVFKKRG